MSWTFSCLPLYEESERKWSCSVVSHSLPPHGLYSSWNSPGQNTGVGSHSLLQGTFPTQGSNPGLLYSGWILYQLSHQGSPRILDWVAYPFSSRYSWPRNQTGVSCIAGRFFTNWAQGSPLPLSICHQSSRWSHQIGINCSAGGFDYWQSSLITYTFSFLILALEML